MHTFGGMLFRCDDESLSVSICVLPWLKKLFRPKLPRIRALKSSVPTAIEPIRNP